MSEPPRCTALKADGAQCGVTWGLSAEGRCLMHDPERRAAADAARRAAGATTGALAATQARPGKYRTVAPDAVPGRRPPRSLHDVIVWASWCAYAAATGLLDGVSVREINRSLGTLKDAIHKADLLKRIRALEVKLRQYERERGA